MAHEEVMVGLIINGDLLGGRGALRVLLVVLKFVLQRINLTLDLAEYELNRTKLSSDQNLPSYHSLQIFFNWELDQRFLR